MQLSAVPEQWSVASQTPPFEVPVQVVVVGSNASAGQEPLVPVQSSSTSHWPVSARHTVVEAWYSSTQLSAVPEQWSVASQTPPFEVPVQVVVVGSNASAGQEPLVPVQSSSTSHWPVSARQTVVEDWYSSTQLSAVPEQ
jgi:hypothetical protein